MDICPFYLLDSNLSIVIIFLSLVKHLLHNGIIPYVFDPIPFSNPKFYILCKVNSIVSHRWPNSNRLNRKDNSVFTYIKTTRS